MDSLGEKIESLRKEKGYSLRELGKICNLSHSYISDIEKGRTNPSLETLVILAKNLNTSISYLVGEVSEINVNSIDKTKEDNEILNLMNRNTDLKKLLYELSKADSKDINLLIKTWKFVKSISEDI